MSKEEIRQFFQNNKPGTAVKKYRKETIPHILKFLNDKEDIVQRNAIVAFGIAGKRIGVSRKDVKTFVGSLDKISPQFYPEVAKAIADTGDVAIMSLISRFQEKLKSNQKEIILQILSEIGQEKIIEGLMGEKITNPAQSALHELLLRTQTSILEGSNISTYDPDIDYSAQLDDFKKLLSKMLSSKNEQDLYRALDACENFPTISSEFIKTISSVIGRSEDLTIKALSTLGELKNPEAIPKIVSQLTSASNEIIIAATNALGVIGDKNGVEPILKHVLNSQDEFIRQSAVNALGKIGAPAAGELVKLLQKEEYKEQVEIALKRIGEPAVKYLKRAMGDSNKIIRKNATDIAKMILTTKYGIAGTVLKLIEMLSDKDTAVQEHVVETIINMGDPGLENVLRALSSKDKNIRNNSKLILDNYALMNIKLVIENAVKTNIISGAELFFLLGIFSDDEETVDYAFSRLEELDQGQEFNIAVKQAIIDNVFVYNDLFSEPDENLRFNIAQISGFLGTPVINYLVEYLSDKSNDVIEGALNSLAYLGEAAYTTVTHIKKFAQGKNLELRKAAIRALGQIKDPEGISSILEAMRADDEELRQIATEAIDKIGVSSIPPIINLLDTNNPETQDNLIDYLMKFDYNILRTSILDSLANESSNFQQGILKLNKRLAESNPDFPEFLLTEVQLIPNNTIRQAGIRTFGVLRFEPALPFLIDELLKRDKKYNQAILDAIYLGYRENFVRKCLNEIETSGIEIQKAVVDFLKIVDSNFTVIPLIEQLSKNPIKKEKVIELLNKIGDKAISKKLSESSNRAALKTVLVQEPALSKIVEKLSI